ncbi:MAG: hypothetical protein ACD_28C00148G0002 [uncultured bacterium]|nr:MAG: hypothetical protein ACD_28C00148G0002 [uncultured bacterium]
MSIDQVEAMLSKNLHSLFYHKPLMAKHIGMEHLGIRGRIEINIVMNLYFFSFFIRRANDIHPLKMGRKIFEHFIKNILLAVRDTPIASDHEEVFF